MHTILLNCGNTHKQYKIVAECSNAKTTLALAGFCAEEQAENTLFRHLQNLCVQSDGSLSDMANSLKHPRCTGIELR
jgi:hypothetical protein